ncbi:hypothetical protein VWM68_10450, partial [Campylobacter coli]
KITTAEGISIINDTSFIAKIAKDLIDAVEIIFAREKVLWDDIIVKEVSTKKSYAHKHGVWNNATQSYNKAKKNTKKVAVIDYGV